MSAEETLAEIQKSLETKKPAIIPTTAKAEALDVAQALLKLPELINTLKVFADEKQRQTDWLESFNSFQFEVEKLAVKADSNLKQTADLAKSVKTCIDGFRQRLGSMEASHTLLVTRVSDVLGELEKTLKHL